MVHTRVMGMTESGGKQKTTAKSLKISLSTAKNISLNLKSLKSSQFHKHIGSCAEFSVQ